MGTLLAKLPQQRVRAPENHPTFEKLEKLFDYMDDLGLDLVFELDCAYVVDRDRPKDKRWEIRDIINSEYILELPVGNDEYKITQTVDISPREAQPAPETPGQIAARASGLNHFKQVKAKKPKGKVKATKAETRISIAEVAVAQAQKLFQRGKK